MLSIPLGEIVSNFPHCVMLRQMTKGQRATSQTIQAAVTMLSVIVQDSKILKKYSLFGEVAKRERLLSRKTTWHAA